MTSNLKNVNVIRNTLIILLSFCLNSVEVLAQEHLVIEDIICQGNDNTRCDFIRQKYYQQVGENVDPNEIADAELRLGTLIQFRDVHFRLSKGSTRGNVVVVIEVVEANHIQYDIGFTSNTSTFTSSSQSLGLINKVIADYQLFGINGEVTNYNFFGTGKQLSFGLSLQSEENESTSKSTVLGITSQDSASLDFRRQVYRLNYYDPHLFSSPYSYFRAQATLTKNKVDGYIIVPSDDFKTYSLGLGRRFARFSYIEAVWADLPDIDDSQTQLNYGWDSRDDSILPTQGSLLETSLVWPRKDEQLLQGSYRKYYQLRTDNIFSIGISAIYQEIDGAGNNDFTSNNLTLNTGYTRINAIDATEGTYSGWIGEVSVSRGNLKSEGAFASSADSTNYALNLSYIRQTNSLITRFSLYYGNGEFEDR